MRSLSTQELQAVSGGALDILDLGYLFAGYHHLDMNNTMLVGLGVGGTLGIFNLLVPASNAASAIGIISTAAWIAVPALFGVGIAFVEYQIGSYCSSLVNQA